MLHIQQVLSWSIHTLLFEDQREDEGQTRKQVLPFNASGDGVAQSGNQSYFPYKTAGTYYKVVDSTVVQQHPPLGLQNGQQFCSPKAGMQGEVMGRLQDGGGAAKSCHAAGQLSISSVRRDANVQQRQRKMACYVRQQPSGRRTSVKM